ncbi:MAG: glycosyltransferase family 2 protein [Acidobacteria bacterium]|nr:glycosyltransferase family 2 protein [Acidobacteriota bacterium]
MNKCSAHCSDSFSPSVSIVIPCYNGAEYIRETLKRTFSQRCNPHEVLFIDDGSTDYSFEIAVEFPVRLMRNEKNRGLAYARNRAIDAVSGDVIMFLDVDAWPAEDLIELIMKEFSRKQTEVVCGRGIEVNVQNKYDAFRKRFFSQDMGCRRKEDAPVMFGLCSAIRKDVLVAIGGYNPEFLTNGEDFDLAFRLRAAGTRIIYNPDLKVFHHRRDDRDSFFRLVYRWYYWGARAYQVNGKAYLLPFLIKAVADIFPHFFFSLGLGNVRALWIPFRIAALRIRAVLDLEGRKPPDPQGYGKSGHPE